MRAFVALPFPPPIVRALDRSAAALRAGGVTGRFSPAGNVHLTLAFLGELPAGRVRDAADALEACPRRGFPVALTGFGVFRREGGDVLWRAVSAPPALDALQRALCAGLAARGIAFDRKPFRPHVTVARGAVLPGGLSPEALTAPELCFAAGTVTLFRSDLSGPRPRYTPLAQIRLDPPAD